MKREKNVKSESKVSNRALRNVKSESFAPGKGGNFLTVRDAAEILGKQRKTVHAMCERGELTAIAKPYGDTMSYLIPSQAVSLYLEQQKQKERLVQKAVERKQQMTDHEPYVEGFVRVMKAGLIGKTGKFAKTTLTLYRKQVERYLELYPQVTFPNFVNYLAKFPDAPGKQMNIYRAILAFSKYLIREGVLDKNFVKDVEEQGIRVRANKNPKRPVVKENEIPTLLEAEMDPMERAMVLLLVHTGVRAAECAKVRIPHVDLDKRELWIPKAKWNKQRRLGLSKEVVDAIRVYLFVRPVTGPLRDDPEKPNDFLFLDRFYNPMSRDGVYKRLRNVGKRVGVVVSPHMLRRRFATHHLLGGKSVREVQTAMGHASPQMTLLYDRTSEQHVVDAMKDWD
ncbi:MAG: tyrosine-type recombinase/integrase [Candidatus Melainabacteria bacterium]|nr:tyrosine-type recombinase/integrase [Candidatus Melainabacteria bacterium]